jgi:hypothetical protein
VARQAIDGVVDAIACDRLAPERVTTALARIHALRTTVARRRAADGAPLAWPAHARLARRLAARGAA